MGSLIFSHINFTYFTLLQNENRISIPKEKKHEFYNIDSDF